MKSAPFHSYFIAVGKLGKTHEVAMKTSYGYEKLVPFHPLDSTLFHSNNFIARNYNNNEVAYIYIKTNTLK